MAAEKVRTKNNRIKSIDRCRDLIKSIYPDATITEFSASIVSGIEFTIKSGVKYTFEKCFYERDPKLVERVTGFGISSRSWKATEENLKLIIKLDLASDTEEK